MQQVDDTDHGYTYTPQPLAQPSSSSARPCPPPTASPPPGVPFAAFAGPSAQSQHADRNDDTETGATQAVSERTVGPERVMIFDEKMPKLGGSLFPSEQPYLNLGIALCCLSKALLGVSQLLRQLVTLLLDQRCRGAGSASIGATSEVSDQQRGAVLQATWIPPLHGGSR